MTNSNNTALVGYASRLGDGIGCLRIRNLDIPQTPAIMRKLILDLGEIRGLVLDLRDTHGDNFDYAVNTIPLLLNEGVIWQTQQRLINRGKGGIATSTIRVTPKALEWSGQYPPFAEKKTEWRRQPILVENKIVIVVLLSEGSGTAAGVIASALGKSPRVVTWGGEVKLRTAPTQYFAVNNGKTLQLVQEGPRVDRFGEVIDPVAVCTPHHKSKTDVCEDPSKLINSAKKGILKVLDKHRRPKQRSGPIPVYTGGAKRAKSAAAAAVAKRAEEDLGLVIDVGEERWKAPRPKKIEIHDDYGVLVRL